MCNFTNMIGGLILYVRAPSLDHFVFENKNVKILFRFCRRHYFDLRIIGCINFDTPSCLYYTANIMLDVNVKMLFTLFYKSLIYYTKFENYLLSFLTFAVFD